MERRDRRQLRPGREVRREQRWIPRVVEERLWKRAAGIDGAPDVRIPTVGEAREIRGEDAPTTSG
jgi:hypothetical protein